MRAEPDTRHSPGMRRIYTALVLWNLAIWAAAAVLGLGSGTEQAHLHRLAGLFAAVFNGLVHSLLIIHFIGSMKWIQQTGPTAGLEDTKVLRTAWVKGRMFPNLIGVTVVGVAAAMSGGAAGDGSGWLAVHIALSVATAAWNVYVLVLARTGITENHARLRHVAELAHHRQEEGLVEEEPREILVPESTAAGGKVFLFLAANVWVLFVYVRYILRHADEPVWPYAVASAVLAFLGWRMLRGVPA